jgi:hypothetical protein
MKGKEGMREFKRADRKTAMPEGCLTEHSHDEDTPRRGTDSSGCKGSAYA